MPLWVLAAIKGAKKVPWAKVLAAIAWLNTEGRQYWDRLAATERREIVDIALKSKGRRANLSNADLGRLLDLFGKLRSGD